MTVDLATIYGMHEVKPPVFPCPHCGRPITAKQQLAYAAAALGRYLPVYRCRHCLRHTGPMVEPIKNADNT
jgi:hypothetical protein